MKKLKKYIAILSIFLLILIVAIVIIYHLQEEKTTPIGDADKDIKVEMGKLDNSTTYYSIEKMMQKFYLYARVKNKTATYSLLERTYIEQNDINVENVIDKISLNQEADIEFKLKEIYEKQDLLYPVYFIKVITKAPSDIELYYIFYLDNNNGAFAIQPITEQEYGSYIKGEIDFEIKEKTIQQDNYNKIVMKSLEEREIAQRYFDEYIYNALYNIEESYNSIDQEYMQNRFGNIDEYKKYINEWRI